MRLWVRSECRGKPGTCGRHVIYSSPGWSIEKRGASHYWDVWRFAADKSSKLVAHYPTIHQCRMFVACQTGEQQ